MLNYIALYPNEHAEELNMDFLNSTADKSLDYYAIMAMHDFESIENIDLVKYEIIHDQDEVDINRHMINTNYKKKDMDSIVVPKNMYMMNSRFHEIAFTYNVHTNLNQKTIVKRLLIPSEYDGMYLINNKEMKTIWQLVDASTYSRRGLITMKSRYPIIICKNKKRLITDVHGTEYVVPTYSYMQDSTRKKRPGVAAAKKRSVKFINPLLIYFSKLGLQKTIKFWGMDGIVKVDHSYDSKEEKKYYIFECNDCHIKVIKEIFDEEEIVRAFVSMFVHLQHKDFPVTMDLLENKEYWMCRIGCLGATKNPNIYSFIDKGRTAIHMIERLLDEFTYESLRLPELYKSNIYYLMYWLITEFDIMKQRINIDMANKRIRKNEVIVSGTLGRKIAENIQKLIERKSKSKMNTIDILLELFNFSSDILMTGMKNMNDIVKSDDMSNDMAFMNDFAYTAKGYNSLGESNSKNIADKYRYLHPSMVGKLDLFTTSNSDCGMSGSIVPFVELYDGFFFTPEREPCESRYKFEVGVRELFGIKRKYPLDSCEEFLEYLTTHNEFKEDLKYEKIEIIEREPTVPPAELKKK